MIHAPKTDEQKRALEQFLAKPPRLRKKQHVETTPTLHATRDEETVVATPIVQHVANKDNKNEVASSDKQQVRKRKRTTPSNNKPNKRQKKQHDNTSESQLPPAPQQQSLQNESVFALLQSVESVNASNKPTTTTSTTTAAPRVSKRKAANVNKSHYESNMPVCTFYLQGKCAKGAACIFKHEGELISHKQEICKFFLANACAKGDECPFSHDSSTFPCKFFFILNKCSKGAECKFSHQEPTAEQMDILIKLDKQHREQKEAAATKTEDAATVTEEDKEQKEDVPLFDPFAAIQPTQQSLPSPTTYMPQSPPQPPTDTATIAPSFRFGNVFAK